MVGGNSSEHPWAHTLVGPGSGVPDRRVGRWSSLQSMAPTAACPALCRHYLMLCQLALMLLPPPTKSGNLTTGGNSVASLNIDYYCLPESPLRLLQREWHQ
jgi:hypothetical protein